MSEQSQPEEFNLQELCEQLRNEGYDIKLPYEITEEERVIQEENFNRLKDPDKYLWNQYLEFNQSKSQPSGSL